jgi:hypothetical protein
MPISMHEHQKFSTNVTNQRENKENIYFNPLHFTRTPSRSDMIDVEFSVITKIHCWTENFFNAL